MKGEKLTYSKYSKRSSTSKKSPDQGPTCKGPHVMSTDSIGRCLFRAVHTSGISCQSEGDPRAWAVAETGLDQAFWVESRPGF